MITCHCVGANAKHLNPHELSKSTKSPLGKHNHGEARRTFFDVFRGLDSNVPPSLSTHFSLITRRILSINDYVNDYNLSRIGQE